MVSTLQVVDFTFSLEADEVENVYKKNKRYGMAWASIRHDMYRVQRTSPQEGSVKKLLVHLNEFHSNEAATTSSSSITSPIQKIFTLYSN